MTTTPAWLRVQALAGGAREPEAAPRLIAGTAGTQIDGRRPAVEYCG